MKKEEIEELIRNIIKEELPNITGRSNTQLREFFIKNII